jgi:cupin fold WbuC family metalloprotein
MDISRVILTDPHSVRVDEGGRSVGFFCTGLPAKVDASVLSQLKDAASRYPGKNVRLCLHSGPEATFHTMVVLDRKGTYYPPHKHVDKGECWHVIEGSMAAFAFNESGEVIDAQRLDSTDAFLYRLEVGMYHTVIPLTEMVLYHESKPGPFLGSKDSVVPDWASIPSNQMERDEILQRLLTFLP